MNKTFDKQITSKNVFKEVRNIYRNNNFRTKKNYLLYSGSFLR